MTPKTVQKDTKNAERYWRAFYVKPRHEKKVSERLAEDGTEVYCPLVTTRVRWSDRWKKVQKPLINGYVFARVSEQERLKTVKDPGILRTLFWKGKPALIRDEEIETMRLLLEKGSDAKAEPLQPGDRVKVTDGGHTLGITGLEGVVEKEKGQKVLLRIESLQLQLSIMVPPYMLTQIKESTMVEHQADEGAKGD